MRVHMRSNPCLTCGACCVFFRVSFYWGEADPAMGGAVPAELTEDLTGFRRCMMGTNRAKPFCIALLGSVGEAVRCSIYPDRPSPCRKTGVQWAAGSLEIETEELQRCDRARSAWGLPPLSLLLGSDGSFTPRKAS
jgi:Fe-S-cluster containining protein